MPTRTKRICENTLKLITQLCSLFARIRSCLRQSAPKTKCSQIYHIHQTSMNKINGDAMGKPQQVKVSSYIIYSAVASPQDRSKRFTLYFPDRLVHSDTILASLVNIQPYATINARRLLVHISTTVYSFIQLSELEHCRGKILAQAFNIAAQDLNLNP